MAARRLEKLAKGNSQPDEECEASLADAPTDASKVVVLVDKWFVDKGLGFGKNPFGEIVFIHASAVQGAEVLTINIDARVQVVSDHARAKGEGSIEHEESGDRTRGDRCGVHGLTSPFHPRVKQNLSKLLVPTNASLLHGPP